MQPPVAPNRRHLMQPPANRRNSSLILLSTATRPLRAYMRRVTQQHATQGLSMPIRVGKESETTSKKSSNVPVLTRERLRTDERPRLEAISPLFLTMARQGMQYVSIRHLACFPTITRFVSSLIVSIVVRRHVCANKAPWKHLLPLRWCFLCSEWR